MNPLRSVFIAVGLLLALTFSGCSTTGKDDTKKTPKELSELYTEMGTLALMRGEFPQAVEDLRKALKLDSGNAQAHNHLGLAYYGLGKREDAKTSVQRAVAEDPVYSDAYINLGMFAMEEKNHSLAKHYYGKALANLEYKLRHRAYSNMAQLYFNEKNYVESKRNLDLALRNNPDYCPAHFLLGTIYSRENKPAQAAEEFKKSVVSRCVANVEAHYQMGLSYLKVKQYQKAKNAFMFLVQNHPTTVQAQKAGEQLRTIP